MMGSQGGGPFRGSLLMIGASTLVLATQAQAAPAKEPEELKEIVVTATKRSENIQKVPISITAIDKAAIEKLGSPRLRDLEYSVPNLILTGPDNTTRSTVSLRGISTDDRNVGFETGVGVYIDGVFQGRSSGFNQNLSDIQSVEVLRGPQGTLFGKNTIAGAINITTIKPQSKFSGRAIARFGNLGLREGSGYVTGPISSKLLAKISGFGSTRNGTYKNLFTNTHDADKHEYGGRAQLTFLATDNLTFDLSVDAAHDHSRFVESEVTGPDESTPGFVPGPRTIAQQPGLARRNIWGTSLTANYDMGNYVLTSISAYRNVKTLVKGDLDRTPLEIIDAQQRDDNRTFTQEIRLASPAADRFNYLVGFYYLNETALGGKPLFLNPDFLGIDDQYSNDGRVRTNAYAAFGSANYRIVDPLTLTFGVRYTHESKSLRFRQDGTVISNLPDLDLKDKRSDSDIAPTASLSYRFNPKTMAYVKVARGFKSGGWNADFISGSDDNNDGVIDVSETNIRFKPEKLTSYEAGLKTTLLNNRLRFDAAVFWADYKDMQVSQFRSACSCIVISNAGQARSKGAEVEITALPFDGLTLTGGVGYTNAKFTDFANGGGPGVNLKGHYLAAAPKWTANGSAAYEQQLGGSLGSVFVEGSVAYRGDYFSDASNDPFGRIRHYTLVDGRLGWRSPGDRYELFAWGRNLTNKLYAMDRSREEIIFDQEITVYGLPRTYGLQLTARF